VSTTSSRSSIESIFFHQSPNTVPWPQTVVIASVASVWSWRWRVVIATEAVSQSTCASGDLSMDSPALVAQSDGSRAPRGLAEGHQRDDSRLST